MSLVKYSGDWNKATASHLLRRSVFGPKKSEIELSVDNGLDWTIDELFRPVPLNSEPINWMDDLDVVPIGESWVNAVYNGNNTTNTRRRNSLESWIMDTIYHSDLSIIDKMSVFWHNHFTVESAVIKDARFLYHHWLTIRSNALGNFKQFVDDMTIDPTMLRYLDGRQNSKNKPNENYARELMELFTLGKGELAGPGDYTTFTEDDVIELAKALTGWRDRNYNSQNTAVVESYYTSGRHDRSTKTLSHRFNSISIDNQEENEYKAVIDILFARRDCALFIARKFYRYFVGTMINDQIESEIIGPMADMLIDDNYEVSGVIKALLSSQHFYDQLDVVGGIISNPMEYYFKSVRNIPSNLESLDAVERFGYWNRILGRLAKTQMRLFRAPDVAGWQAYYLEPGFSELWVNSVTIQNRQEMMSITMRNNGLPGVNERVKYNYHEFLAQLEQPEDPNELVKEIAGLLYVVDLSDEQVTNLKDILLEGLPDFEWTMEYEEYLSTGSNANSIRNKIRDLMLVMSVLPESHII